MEGKSIRSALISVYHKEGLEEIIKALHQLDVKLYSTGGTEAFIKKLNIPVTSVESLTGYPSILDGRVKTLHPKVFGGILARRKKSHLDALSKHEIPEIDLVIVDLYPFEETVSETEDESKIIEKIDIGGVSLIRAAAKNYQEVLTVGSRDQYEDLATLLEEKEGISELTDRKRFAAHAFQVSSHYDTMIFNWFNAEEEIPVFKASKTDGTELRYGENPHQKGTYFGELEAIFEQLHGKELSYNNLVDIDSAINLMSDFRSNEPTFAVLKHTNACGIATRSTDYQAWKAALAGDPVSAFGGILICNTKISANTAKAIDEIFYEVVIAPEYTDKALEVLTAREKRIVLKLLDYPETTTAHRSLLNGVVVQDADRNTEGKDDLEYATNKKPSSAGTRDLIFANKVVKHLKSNAISLVRNEQLLGMGCGQTSRVDALKQAIAKARQFGLSLHGAVMASDAFFPFPDCVEIADQAGIRAVIQPGGSIRDKDSIDYCNANDMAMALTGIRHFKH